MGFLMAPLAVLLVWLGLTQQAWQLSQAVVGAGAAGKAQTRAAIVGQQTLVFGAACVQGALASPGVVSANLTTTLPAGVTAPVGATCLVASATGGGRNIYGYVPGVAGAAGEITRASNGAYSWYRVQSAGQALRLSTGEVLSVPATIPVGAVLDWVPSAT